MAYNPYGVRRPGGVVFVIVLTWLVAFLTMVSGFLAIAGESARVAGIRLDTGTTPAMGWVEIGFGIITVLVALGLAARSDVARLLVTVLMVVRIAGAVWIGFHDAGQGGWLASALTGGFALLILLLLWNAQADAYFSR
jgi:hypothetical protein